MPFSRKQLRWANSVGKKELGAATVSRWNAEAKGKHLPETSKGAHEKDMKRKFRKALRD